MTRHGAKRGGNASMINPWQDDAQAVGAAAV
jgi:hypothetical protein